MVLLRHCHRMTTYDHGIAISDHGAAMHYHGTSMFSRRYAMVRCPVISPQSCHGMPLAMPWHVLLQCHGNVMSHGSGSSPLPLKISYDSERVHFFLGTPWRRFKPILPSHFTHLIVNTSTPPSRNIIYTVCIFS